jgi:hypothetical protein
MYDGRDEKLARLRTRRPGQPHPFVVGRDAYQRFVTVMSECSQAQLERRKLRERVGRDDTAPRSVTGG